MGRSALRIGTASPQRAGASSAVIGIGGPLPTAATRIRWQPWEDSGTQEKTADVRVVVGIRQTVPIANLSVFYRRAMPDAAAELRGPG